MMEVPTQIRLTRCASGEVELAVIATLSREDAKNLINAVWWKDLGATLRDPDEEPDRHWDWRQLVSVHQNKPFFHAACVKTSDGAIQAATLFRVDAVSALEAGQRAVFMDRLATAPRNRDKFVETPLFRGSGSGLLAYTVAISYSLGFSGRLNLFPVANEKFYRDRGFIPTPVTQGDDTLFELRASTARSMLQKRGLIDA